MFYLSLGILVRIFSNSYLNVFQKLLTNNDEKPSIINFYTYLGLTLLAYLMCPNPTFTPEIGTNFLIMGLLGALGNYFIIKALSCGELSSIAPINSYKPIVALIIGTFLLKEIPTITAVIGILLVIFGTFIIADTKFLLSKACLYRFLALIFSATEAIFIKKIILLSNIPSSFLYWSLAGLIFSSIFAIISKHPIKLGKPNLKYQLSLIALVGIMQYSTNYVFSKMNVSYALALFQLSTLLSVFLGVNIFQESNLKKKILGCLIMVVGAIAIIIS